MIRREHLGYSESQPEVEYFRVDGLTFSKSLYQPGQWADTYVPEAGPSSNWESIHVWLTGCAHAEGMDLPAIVAPYNSRESDAMYSVGKVRRVYDTESLLWCCFWSKKRSCEDVNVLTLKAGETLDLIKDTNVFLFEGKGSIGDKNYDKPTPMSIASEGKKFIAETECWFFVWPKS